MYLFERKKNIGANYVCKVGSMHHELIIIYKIARWFFFYKILRLSHLINQFIQQVMSL